MALSEAPIGQPARYGEVFDRGYKHYDGPQLGRGAAAWALVRYSAKRALGIKKSWTAKIIPILLYVAAAFPVILVVGITAFAPNAEVWDYADFFIFTFVIEGLFVATIAPEMVCGDRRENVLPLYFSRAITRLDYLLAKLVATALLTLTISFIPAFLLWLFLQLLADAPLSAMGDNLDDLARVAVAGGLIALYLGAIGLMISSFTGRKSVAVAVIVVAFLITQALGVALFEAVDRGSAYRDYLVFLSAGQTTIGLVGALWPASDIELSELALWTYVAVMLAVVAICCLVMLWRYVPDE